MKVLSPEEMRNLDAEAIGRLGIPESVLMENAAHAALTILETRNISPRRTGLILCGTGNNGGDGLALARKLHSLGRTVRVCLFGSTGKMTPSSLTNYNALLNLQVPILQDPEEEKWETEAAHAGYIVDALLGTGLNRPVEGRLARLIGLINRSEKTVLSLDIPSGIYGDTGDASGPAVRADMTVSFGTPKGGNIRYPGFSFGGELFCSRISFPPELYDHPRYKCELNLPGPLPTRDSQGYKNSFGKILIIGGGANYYGAPALAANGVFRSGGGFVTVALPASLAPPVAGLCPEAVMHPLKETDEGSIHPENEEILIDLAARHNGVILGPGITRNPGTVRLIRRLIPRIPAPLLIDADALAALAGHPDLTAAREHPTIITPHTGELKRLREGLTDPKNPVENAYKTVTVYKGPHTAVRTPDGREFINLTGNTALGTAGSGDVLTGVIMGLIKSLPGPDLAARTGVLLHGLAADTGAAEGAEDSFTAGDILRYLPRAVRLFREDYDALTDSCYNKLTMLL